MNIVLATAPLGDSPWNFGSFPPLGLLYVAAGVRQMPEVQVKIVDAFCEGLNLSRSLERILSLSPDMLGVTVTSRNFQEAAALLAAVKRERPDVLTIFGGIHPSLFDNLLMREIPELDLILRGEADKSFPELCQRLLRGREICGVPGLSYRAKGSVVSGELQRVEDLDSIPFPDRSLLDYQGYGKQWYGFKLPDIFRLTTAFSSRGCPFRCTFCSDTILCGGRLRTRSAKNVFQELLQLSREGYKAVIFFDDNFTFDATRVEELCRLILDHKINMRLACAGTLHKVPESTLSLMHRAGFDLLFLGVESGSDAMLKRYRKPANRRMIATDIRRAKNARIVTIASFITGGPGETASDHEATKEFVREVKPHICEINPMMVHPGSYLWEEINGSGEPKTLQASSSRLISRFPNQLSKATIQRRLRDFRDTFQETWSDWRRIFELIDLFFHNATVRYVLKSALREPRLLLQFIKDEKPEEARR